jgi:hypothetical protein
MRPLLHDNGLGPEICGQPRHRENFFYRNPYVDAQGKPLPDARAPTCWTYDPSVEGRFKLYVASMQDLLHPPQRQPKITRFDLDVPLVAGLRLVENGKETQLAGLTIVVPKGSSSARLAISGTSSSSTTWSTCACIRRCCSRNSRPASGPRTVRLCSPTCRRLRGNC